MVVLEVGRWEGAGKGRDLTIQKQRIDTEAKGVALIWAMTVGTIIIRFSGRWLAIHFSKKIFWGILLPSRIARIPLDFSFRNFVWRGKVEMIFVVTHIFILHRNLVWMIWREGFVYFFFTDEHRLHSGKLCLIILTCIAEVGVRCHSRPLILANLLQSAIFFLPISCCWP